MGVSLRRLIVVPTSRAPGSSLKGEQGNLTPFCIFKHQDRPLNKPGLKLRGCSMGNIGGLVHSERCPFSFCNNPRKWLWFFSFYSLESWVGMEWGLSKFPEIGWLWAKWQDSVSGAHVLSLYFKWLFLASESVSRFTVPRSWRGNIKL